LVQVLDQTEIIAQKIVVVANRRHARNKGERQDHTT
jgi:hypothetical protein